MNDEEVKKHLVQEHGVDPRAWENLPDWFPADLHLGIHERLPEGVGRHRRDRDRSWEDYPPEMANPAVAEEMAYNSAEVREGVQDRTVSLPVTYYGGPETDVADLFDQQGCAPQEGDILCDNHQMHYRWRDGRWQ